jgi:hypothetical protein
MIRLSATIRRFGKMGEKTGWSYILISRQQAEELNPGCKKSFRVKGQLDGLRIEKAALLPMGEGQFILPFNAALRKSTGKTAGDVIKVMFERDERVLRLSSDFMKCLKDDTNALEFFKNLPKSHQNYFSKWIESAKTSPTKTKRITMAVVALASGQGFGEMMRANKNFR